MRSRVFVLLAGILLAGTSAFASPAGIGVKWGVGVSKFDDNRYSAVSRIVELNFKVETHLTLLIMHEEARVTFDDWALGGSLTYTMTFTGFGLMYGVNDWINTGITIGKADEDSGIGVLDETPPFADFALEVDLLEKTTEKLSYSVSIGVKYRLIEINNLFLPTTSIKTLNNTQFAMKIGVMF